MLRYSKSDRFLGPFKSLVVLGESTVEGGGWLSGPEERWADILWRLLEQAQEEAVTYHNAGIGASVISPQSPGYQGESFLGRKWLIGKKIKKELDKPEGISHAKMV